MKKIKTLGLFAGLAFGWMAVSGAAEAPKAMITFAEGAPMVNRDGKAMPAKPGMEVQKNDLITTSGGCTVDVALDDEIGCRVLPATECYVFETNPQNAKLKLNAGNVVLNLKKLPKDSTFEVETPSAVAAVRGTQFWGRVNLGDPNGPATTFAVRRGIVQITNKADGKSFTLEKGDAIDLGAKAPAVRHALPEELQAMEVADGIKTSM